jgi:hypothetical protein
MCHALRARHRSHVRRLARWRASPLTAPRTYARRRAAEANWEARRAVGRLVLCPQKGPPRRTSAV